MIKESKRLSRTQWLEIIFVLIPTTVVFVPFCLMMIAIFTLGSFLNEWTLHGKSLGIVFGLICSIFFIIPLLGLRVLWESVLVKPENWLNKSRLFFISIVFGILSMLIASLTAVAIGVDSKGEILPYSVQRIGMMYLLLAPTILGGVKICKFIQLKYFNKT